MTNTAIRATATLDTNKQVAKVSTATAKTKPAAKTAEAPSTKTAVSRAKAKAASKTKPVAKAKAPAKKAPAKTEGAETKRKGRASVNSGKRFVFNKEKFPNGNPRRKGSFGETSLQIIIDAGARGITYEDFLEKGGRGKDLNWDLDKAHCHELRKKG